eukprot:s436_g33.t1
MSGAPLNTAPPQETLKAGRKQGQCRICLEDGGPDLIAPCLCKGSGKWVHRRCLDHWRARGQGSRTFTHCPNCHFGYLMELMRPPTKTEQRLRERRRAVLRQAAAHFLLGVLVLQLLLCTVAVLIRLVDSDEELVDIMPFWSLVVPGESKCSFVQAFRYHKTTYYFASVVFCLAMTGLGVIIYYTAKLCAKCCARGVESDAEDSSSSSDSMDGRRNCDCCDVCDTCCWRSPDGSRSVFIYNGGYDGYNYNRDWDCICCKDSCDACREPCCNNCPTFFSDRSSSDDNNSWVLALVFLVILAFLVLIGLFFAMAALVAWIQKVAQKYLALKELQVLTGEYIVKDLELEKQYNNGQGGQDLEQGQNIEPSAPSAPMWVPMMPQEVQTNLYRDLQAVYGMESR